MYDVLYLRIKRTYGVCLTVVVDYMGNKEKVEWNF